VFYGQKIYHSIGVKNSFIIGTLLVRFTVEKNSSAE